MARNLSSADQSQSVSVSVRKIENGFVTCRSEDGPSGYRYSEEFSATRPNLSAGPDKEPSAGPSSLAKAIKVVRDIS